jgi:TolB-like protein/DNA-binding winged helix-turn-helix (wHTH) protein
MAEAPRHRYRFDDLTLDVGQCRVWRGAQPIQLSKLTFELLRVLVEAAPNLVTHDQLAQHVWGTRRVVTPENLSQRLMMLRQAIGDPADRPRYIEGVRGLGYRLIPAVAAENERVAGDATATVATNPAPAASEEPAHSRAFARRTVGYAAAAIVLALGVGLGAFFVQQNPLLVRLGWAPVGPHSVAVIPFANLSPSEEDQYFAFGLHQEVINQLVKVSDLTVISRTTMMRYADGSKTPREIASDLDVETVLEGSVRRAGDTVRVAVQLVDPSTDTNLWSATYDGDLANVANIFAIQANIATNVSSALAARLSLQEQSRLAKVPTTSGAAYGHYLAALAADQSSSPEGSARALEELRQAVAIDPQFALAWATLSYTLSVAPTWRPDRTREYQSEAIETALRALALEPELAEAHKALSFASTVNGDWQRSEDEYAQALDLGATRAEVAERGNFELAVGRIEEARATFRNNQGVNPLNSTGLAFFLAASEILDDRDAVRDGYEQGRAFMGPWPFGEYLMNYVRLGRGELDELADDTAAAPRFRADFAAHGSSAEGLAAVRSWYDGLAEPNHNEHMVAAAWAAHYGDIEFALRAAAGATEVRAHNVWFLWLPLFEDTRRTPAFKRLIADLGLVDYWRLNEWPSACRAIGSDDFECD